MSSEKLADLPVKDDIQHSQEEEGIMDTFFGNDTAKPTPPEEEGFFAKLQLKKVGIMLLFFALLCSGVLDGMFEKIPYIEGNQIATLILKSGIFALVFMIVNYVMA